MQCPTESGPRIATFHRLQEERGNDMALPAVPVSTDGEQEEVRSHWTTVHRTKAPVPRLSRHLPLVARHELYQRRVRDRYGGVGKRGSNPAMAFETVMYLVTLSLPVYLVVEQVNSWRRG